MAFQPELLGVMVLMLTTPVFWLCLMITCVVAILPDFIFKYVNDMYYVEPSVLLHEKEVGWNDGVFAKVKKQTASRVAPE